MNRNLVLHGLVAVGFLLKLVRARNCEHALVEVYLVGMVPAVLGIISKKVLEFLKRCHSF
jgi:hypothetical protein